MRSGMLERQALQQHAVDDAEHRGVGANADGKRENHDRGENRGLEQHPHGMPQIANESVHVGSPTKQYCCQLRRISG